MWLKSLSASRPFLIDIWLLRTTAFFVTRRQAHATDLWAEASTHTVDTPQPPKRYFFFCPAHDAKPTARTATAASRAILRFFISLWF